MIRKLMDLFRPKRIEDPVFGTLLFMKTNDASKSYWEGAGIFPPLGTRVEYFVDGDENGPGETQHVLFRRIAEQYGQLFERVAPILRREYQAAAGKQAPDNLAAIFRLSGLAIPRRESASMDWTMDFTCGDAEDCFFSVSISGWQPTGEVSA